MPAMPAIGLNVFYVSSNAYIFRTLLSELSNNCATMNQVARTCFLLTMVVLAVTDLVACADEATPTYIVQLEEPDIGFTSLIDRIWWYASFVGGEKSLMYAYNSVITGFAARLTEADVEAMREMTGFVTAYPDAVRSLHNTYSSQFLGLNPAKGLWPSTELGNGVIVGVLDTGVWPESPSFTDHGMPSPPAKWKGVCETAPDFNASNCNNKLIGARVFLKGSGDPNPTPRDKEGHGTHTSSTAAGNHVPDANLFGYANGTASGMASSAHVAVYKVCVESGCFDSDILAGMDQAIEDGVDVLSLSIGGDVIPLYQDGIAMGAFTAIQKGIFVSCSAGNSGPAYFSMENESPWIMTVGASTMDRNFIATVKLGDGTVLYGESLYPSKGQTQPLPLIHVRTESGNLCLNGSLDSSDVAGKMVLCERGTSARVMKGDVVRQAGGAGMILMNDEASGEEIISDPHVLPATLVGYTAGVAIKTYLNSTKIPPRPLILRAPCSAPEMHLPWRRFRREDPALDKQ
ncbi:hypothetical protein KI387_043701 [Taxus chinensis]|uniref:Subtilisin-like protease SBT1.7 n=1 Tax=Taxus chinensis TaxID=29808 RepID=A0AA38LRG7_TAXCH|nr:hypothetical protein KI387_043701 [Taxus chinensis]